MNSEGFPAQVHEAFYRLFVAMALYAIEVAQNNIIYMLIPYNY